MLNRRTSLSSIAAIPAVFMLPAVLTPRAWASPAGDRAAAFITTAGGKLVTAINGTGTLEQRHQVLGGIIDDAVDVNGVAHFCLGRFWRTATAAQQQQYLGLFRNALVVNIASKIGEYQGVRFTVGTTQDRDFGEFGFHRCRTAEQPARQRPVGGGQRHDRSEGHRRDCRGHLDAHHPA